MIYRPQFVFAIPQGCSEDGYEHYYDTTILPALTVASGSPVRGILFQLDRDAQFIWRGFKVAIPGTNPGLGMQWKDAEGNLLSDGFISTLLYGTGQGYAAPFSGGMSVIFDEQIICPPGSVIESNWSREIVGSSATVPPSVTLLGEKRRYNRSAV